MMRSSCQESVYQEPSGYLRKQGHLKDFCIIEGGLLILSGLNVKKYQFSNISQLPDTVEPIIVCFIILSLFYGPESKT
jgi:hypothetical protein